MRYLRHSPVSGPALPIGCAILAAGFSRRFGEDKLSAVIGGQTLLERAFQAVPAEEFSAAAVVLPDRGGAENASPLDGLAARYGFSVLRNPNRLQGISASVRLGTEYLMDRCDAIAYLTADQPLLRRESVGKLLDLWRATPGKIAALAHDGVRGNPCVFPAKFFPELLALEGDRGGSAVIRRHPSDLILLEVPAEELLDADTPEALEQMQQYL